MFSNSDSMHFRLCGSAMYSMRQHSIHLLASMVAGLRTELGQGVGAGPSQRCSWLTAEAASFAQPPLTKRTSTCCPPAPQNLQLLSWYSTPPSIIMAIVCGACLMSIVLRLCTAACGIQIKPCRTSALELPLLQQQQTLAAAR